MYFALTASSVQEEGNGNSGSWDTGFTHTVSSGPISGATKQYAAGIDKEDIQDHINEDGDKDLAYPQLHEEKVLFYGFTGIFQYYK